MRGDSCSVAEKNLLTVLTPQDNTNTFVGDEVQLLFYVPEVTDKMAEIYVEDPETFDIVYEASFELPDTPGLISVRFPAVNQTTGEPLQPGTEYAWEFAVICNPTDRASDLAVSGLIEPVELSEDAVLELETTSQPLQEVAVYAGEGVWQETLIRMVNMRCTNESDWTELLTSVGLEDIVEQSLTNCAAQR